MGWNVFKKINFYYNFYEKRKVPSIYRAIHYEQQEDPIYTQAHNGVPQNVGPMYITLFPSYLSFRTGNHVSFHLKKVFRTKGYAMALESFENVAQYINAQFKPNFRTSLRRKLNGLETCFNVRYRMFYGPISLEKYNILMDSLRNMLVRRFQQRNEENMALGKWDAYYKDTFKMINEKKASLFVIYDDETPIQISLSFHIHKIIFLSVPSYDIDYAKFGLGNVSIKKILEWCFDNGYLMLDMGYGAFDYKLKWCNQTYDFEHHLFYKKSSFKSQITATIITAKTQLINYMLAKNMNTMYRQLKDGVYGKKANEFTKFSFEKGNPSIEELQLSKRINPLTDASYAYIKGAVYDFLYINLEHVANIEVYELENNKVFYFKGLKQVQKVVFEN